MLTYGEAGAGTWRVVKAQSFERWLLAGAVVQVQRTLAYSDFITNAPGFEASRAKARPASDATMVRQTVEGPRYFNKQKDGDPQGGGQGQDPRAGRWAAVLLVDPTLPFPVVPLAGLAYFDFNAFNRGIQVNAAHRRPVQPGPGDRAARPGRASISAPTPPPCSWPPPSGPSSTASSSARAGRGPAGSAP